MKLSPSASRSLQIRRGCVLREECRTRAETLREARPRTSRRINQILCMTFGGRRTLCRRPFECTSDVVAAHAPAWGRNGASSNAARRCRAAACGRPDGAQPPKPECAIGFGWAALVTLLLADNSPVTSDAGPEKRPQGSDTCRWRRLHSDALTLTLQRIRT